MLWAQSEVGSWTKTVGQMGFQVYPSCDGESYSWVCILGEAEDCHHGDDFSTPEAAMVAADGWLSEQARLMIEAVGLSLRTPAEGAVLKAAKQWGEATDQYLLSVAKDDLRAALRAWRLSK